MATQSTSADQKTTSSATSEAGTSTQSSRTLVINAPPPGQEYVIDLHAGGHYILAFPVEAIEDMSLNKGDMRLTLEDGSVIILHNYEASAEATNPASFAFEDGGETQDLADFILDAQTGILTQTDLAEMEPAAGQEAPSQSAQQASQIQPQAGEAAAAGGAGNSGYGFNSSIEATTAQPAPLAVGAIEATALNYAAGPLPSFVQPTLLQTAAPFDPSPVITANTGAEVAESLLFMHQPGAIGQIVVNYDTDTPGRVNFDGNFTIEGFEEQGLELTSGGRPVSVTFDADINTFRGFDADGNLLFTLVMDPVSGTYVFSLLGPLDHPDGSNPGDAINIDFAFTATDSNGDQASSSMRVTITDTGPQIACPTELHVGESIEIGQAITDQVNVEFNADGYGDVRGDGAFSVDNLDEHGLELTSGGMPVTVTMDANGNYLGTLANGTIVFTLTFNDSGLYTFTLLQGLDHIENTPIQDTITLHFGYTATDADGDGVSDSIAIIIHDDPAMPEPLIAINSHPALQAGELYSAHEVLINLENLTPVPPQAAVTASHALDVHGLSFVPFFAAEGDALQTAIDHFVSKASDQPVVMAADAHVQINDTTPFYSPADHILGSLEQVMPEIKQTAESLAA